MEQEEILKIFLKNLTEKPIEYDGDWFKHDNMEKGITTDDLEYTLKKYEDDYEFTLKVLEIVLTNYPRLMVDKVWNANYTLFKRIVEMNSQYAAIILIFYPPGIIRCICQAKIQSNSNRKFSHSLPHRTAVKNCSSRPFFLMTVLLHFWSASLYLEWMVRQK